MTTLAARLLLLAASVVGSVGTVARSRLSLVARASQLQTAEPGGAGRRGGLLLRAASAPTTAAYRTLLTLDANKDGRVDTTEIQEFARSQGLNGDGATAEFGSLDTNGDGSLDSAELAVALGGTDSPPETAQAVAALPAEPSGARNPTPPTKPAAAAAPLAPTMGVTVAPSLANTTAAHGGVLAASAGAAPEQRLNNQQAAPPLQPATQGAMVETSQGEDARTGAATRARAAAAIEKALADEEEQEDIAEKLERQAVGLRANSTSIATRTKKQAREAAARAVKAKAAELLSSVEDLQRRALDAELEAAELRTRMTADTAQAEQLVDVANGALSGVATEPAPTLVK
mmetsp:Transcript_80238/g.223460  ORF Transcript_80238/g.223460 Transcript_80238/m.223460 type:complete len:345 (+) Transcript_80238:93-1127(+)